MIKRAKLEMPKTYLFAQEANKLPFKDNSMDFIQWFKEKEINKIKSEYLFIPEYRHSYHRFNIIVNINKNN